MKIKIGLIQINKGSCWAPWAAYTDRCMAFRKIRSAQNELDDLTGFRFMKNHEKNKNR